MNDVVPRSTAGLEYLHRIIRGEIPGVPTSYMPGYRLVEAEEGRVALLGNPDERSYNLMESVHGGWSAAILDTALALSILTTLDAEQALTTVEVRAEGRVLQSGRRLAYSEARLTDVAGKLICHGTGSCLIMPRS